MKKNKRKKKKMRFKDLFLYCCFIVTIFIDLTYILSWSNICYLPINTTGECVLARSLLTLDLYLPFVITETIFSIIVTVLYLIDGFREKNKIYKIVGITNFLLQPLLIFAVISFIW